MVTVPRKTKLLMDLNNNQYKLSGLRAENKWKSGKAIKTPLRLPSKFWGFKQQRGRSNSAHRKKERKDQKIYKGKALN